MPPKDFKRTFATLLLIAIFVIVAGFTHPVLPSAASPGQTTAAWVDDFSSTSLDSRWSWIREDASHWSLSDHPGFLRIITQAGGLSSNDASNLLLTTAPGGDFEITTRVTITPTEAVQHAALLIYQDDDNYISINRAYLDDDALTFDFEDHGVFTYTRTTVTETTLWLRITKDESTYTGLYSLDGGTWNPLGQYDASFAPIQVGLKAGHGDPGTASLPADFDNFALKTVQYEVYLPAIIRPAEADIPQLVSPANGVVLDTLIPVFAWDTGTQPSGATLCLALSKSPHPAECQLSYLLDYLSPKHEEVMWYNLDPSTVYYWRIGVIAAESADPVWSDERSFTTGAAGGPILPAPGLQAPPTDSTIIEPNVTLVWQPVPGALEYSLSVHGTDTNRWAGFGSGAETQKTIDLADLVQRGYGYHYEWYLETRNGYAWSGPSASWKFTYAPGAHSFEIAAAFDLVKLFRKGENWFEQIR